MIYIQLNQEHLYLPEGRNWDSKGQPPTLSKLMWSWGPSANSRGETRQLTVNAKAQHLNRTLQYRHTWGYPIHKHMVLESMLTQELSCPWTVLMMILRMSHNWRWWWWQPTDEIRRGASGMRKGDCEFYYQHSESISLFLWHFERLKVSSNKTG